MLTLAAVATQPELLYYDVRLRDGTALLYRPLLARDGQALTGFLESLSPHTRERWTLDSYDRIMAESLCADIGRYDKLRLVAVDPPDLDEDQTGDVVALFEFSFGIPSGDLYRYTKYGVELDETHDCRFGPCVRDADQRRGIASALMAPTFAIARRFGKSRMILWGGVFANNEPALAFYRKQGFGEVGRFSNSDGKACVDMMRLLA
ncbi:MAG: N-acetyltransferase [Chloroflexi bacterium]|nr:MAG: N-acetyltransferase [Chloroflexota bacterium]